MGGADVVYVHPAEVLHAVVQHDRDDGAGHSELSRCLFFSGSETVGFRKSRAMSRQSEAEQNV